MALNDFLLKSIRCTTGLMRPNSWKLSYITNFYASKFFRQLTNYVPILILIATTGSFLAIASSIIRAITFLVLLLWLLLKLLLLLLILADFLCFMKERLKKAKYFNSETSSFSPL